MTKRSCCSSLTCCGMAIETGCYIFSIINAVFCILWVIASLGSLRVSEGAIMSWQATRSPDPERIRVTMHIVMGTSLASFAASSVAIIFAVFLCIGVSKKNPRYILAYLIYGVVTEVLSVLGTLGFIGFGWERPDFNMYMIFASVSFGALLIYSLLLLLVYQTFVVLSARTTNTGHARLQETQMT